MAKSIFLDELLYFFFSKSANTFRNELLLSKMYIKHFQGTSHNQKNNNRSSRALSNLGTVVESYYFLIRFYEDGGCDARWRPLYEYPLCWAITRRSRLRRRGKWTSFFEVKLFRGARMRVLFEITNFWKGCGWSYNLLIPFSVLIYIWKYMFICTGCLKFNASTKPQPTSGILEEDYGLKFLYFFFISLYMFQPSTPYTPGFWKNLKTRFLCFQNLVFSLQFDTAFIILF